MRRFLQTLILLAVLAVLVGTCFVTGVLAPHRVDGPSMAPALLGTHVAVVCHDCAFEFSCGREFLPADSVALCPNCGALCDLSQMPLARGDRLLIDRSTYALQPPERWDAVVFPSPVHSQALCVKRIVGLPGETVELRGGDVYVDGQIARKSWRQLADLAVSVSDDRCRPPSIGRTLPAWKAEAAESGWSDVPAGYRRKRAFSANLAQVEPRAAAKPAIDWLLYRHEQRLRRGSQVERRAGPILDDLAYNQSESRELVPVPDVLLRCWVRMLKGGMLWLQASDGCREFRVRIAADTGRGELLEAGEVQARVDLGAPLTRARYLLLALADAQVSLAVDGQTLLEHPYEPATGQPVASDCPLAIGAEGGDLELEGVEVLRDLYYLPASRTATAGPRKLADDEVWVLGDNSSVSDDSRSWPTTSKIGIQTLLGRVLRPR